jgi:hypothetical protein
MKSVPGPRRVVVSFQFVGFELAVMTCAKLEMDRKFIDSALVPNTFDFRHGTLPIPRGALIILCNGESRDEGGGWLVGEKNNSSVCHRGTSNSWDPLLARTVSQ